MVRTGPETGTRGRQTMKQIRTTLTVGAGLALIGVGAGLTAQQPTTSPAAIAAVSGQTAYPGGRWEPGPARHGSTVVDGVKIPMDDGVVLDASLSYPTDLATGQRAAGTFPVVIEHTPYVRAAGADNLFITQHGYIYAVVRERGTGTSQGEVGFYNGRSAQDGRNLADWAARTQGSDGRVAFVGCSAPGGMALAALSALAPNSPVKAGVVSCNGFEGPYRQAWFVSGMVTGGMLYYAPRAVSSMGGTPAVARFFPPVMAEILRGGPPAYDNGFYDDRLPMSGANKVVAANVPVLLWTGWQDFLDAASIRTYVGLQNAYAKRPVDAAMTPNQVPTPRYQLIVGPWGHSQGLHAGIYLQWLETWVKGVDTGIGRTTTPMHLYETGTGRWINTARYPVVGAYTQYRLQPGGQLATAAPAAGGETLRYARPNTENGTLNFMSVPFAQGATLAGPISATLYASSSNTNMVLIPRLFDVAPDGAETLITKGGVLGSLRELDEAKSWKDQNGVMAWPWLTLKRDAYLTPQQVYRLDAPMGARQYGIRPGHRLKLEIITQNTAEICPDNLQPPVNSDNLCGLTAPQQATVPGAVYRILYGPNQISALNLPLLPYQAMPEVRSGVLPPATPTPAPGAAAGAAAGGGRGGGAPNTHPLDWGR